MDFNKKQLTVEEIKINQLLADTIHSVTKLEKDIEKLIGTKSVELNYNMSDLGTQDILRIRTADKLSANIENLKSVAIKEADEILAALPAGKREIVRQAVVEKLYPEKEKESLGRTSHSLKDLTPLTEVFKDAAPAHEQNSRQINSLFKSRFMEEKPLHENLQRQNFSQFLNYRPEEKLNKNVDKDKEDR